MWILYIFLNYVIKPGLEVLKHNTVVSIAIVNCSAFEVDFILTAIILLILAYIDAAVGKLVIETSFKEKVAALIPMKINNSLLVNSFKTSSPRVVARVADFDVNVFNMTIAF